MLKKLFEESERPSQRVVESIAVNLFEGFCKEFDEYPSQELCEEFIDVMPTIASHESLIGALVEKLFDWRNIYLGFGMFSEWDRLVRSASAKVIRYLGYEEGWDLLSKMHLFRVLVASMNGNYRGIETAFEIAIDFGFPERDLFINIERISALVNSYGAVKLLALYQEARQYFDEAMEQFEPGIKLRALVMMSRLESKIGNHAVAFELAQQGIILAQKLDNVSLAVSLLSVLILPYLESNTRHHYLQDVFEFWDQNIPQENHFGRALFNGNYGVFLIRREDYAGARHYLSRACEFYRHAGWEMNLGRILLSLGTACGYDNDFRAAEAVYSDALEIYTKLDIPDHMVMSYINLGWVYAEMGNQHQAVLHYECALSKAKSLPDSDWKTSLIDEIKKDLGNLQ